MMQHHFFTGNLFLHMPVVLEIFGQTGKHCFCRKNVSEFISKHCCFLEYKFCFCNNVCQSFSNSAYPRRTKFNSCFVIQLYLYRRVIACIVNKNLSLRKPFVFPAFGMGSISWCDVIMSYDFDQYIYDQITSYCCVSVSSMRRRNYVIMFLCVLPKVIRLSYNRPQLYMIHILA